jgi:glycosyltransferase involved in cell wall biosynthesis
MEGGKKYIIEKGWNIESGGKIDLNKVHYINNGVDIGDFDRNKKLFQIADEDLENENIFKVIYLGSIRLANNLRQLIDAAEILKDNSNIQFLIYGDGDDRAFLEDRCRNLGLKNVKFKQKSVELTYVPYILSRSSLNILNYMKSPITRYGGSQSKSFQYMASGKPICGNMNMAFCPITKYNLGISKEFETAQEYADTILSFAMMDKSEYNVLCKNSRNAAFNYDYRKLTSDY